MKANRILTSLVLMTSALAAKTQTVPQQTNGSAPTVTWDKRSIIIDGRPVLPVMGEMHYSRVPESEWRREIQKMKAGGVTMMATYVFWNHHEDAEPGVWNWSGNRNLRRFVQVCGEECMPVVLRVGPFCHGEVYQGGLPCWIVQKSIEDKNNYRLRSLAPGFIDAVAKLYNQIGAQVRGLMWSQRSADGGEASYGGPVIAVQLENECRGPWPYFVKLLELAHNAGLDTPFYTRTGWPAMNGKAEFGKILPLYGDYGDGFWARELTDMPGTTADAFKMKDTRLSAVIASEVFGPDQDTQMKKGDLGYPYLTCELGGGMMQSYHRRINMNGREAFPLVVCKLGSGSNLPGYYMYHGGTNPEILNPVPNSHDHPMSETQNSPTTNYNDLPLKSYDFQTILGEMGRPDPVSWHETRWVHQFLKDWGEELTQMDVDTLSEHFARRGQFVFRNDYVRIKNEAGSASITPCQMQWQGLTITSDDVQPFAKADGLLYFIVVVDRLTSKRVDKLTSKLKTCQLIINNKKYSAKLDKPLTVDGQTLVVLSPAKARQAYVVDGRMYYGDGILYKDGDRVMQELWQTDDAQIKVTQTKREDAPRDIPMGSHGVAHQPENPEFDKAAVWALDLTGLDIDENTFLEVSYAGDVARVYANGQLVEDNFWNGKPMMVRASDLTGKHIELKILPLRKDAPIYLQQAQRERLEAASGNCLLSLDGIKVIRRVNRPFP